MPRLIDADEAYKVLTDYYHQRTEIQHKALKEAIERVPTVDAVPKTDYELLLKRFKHLIQSDYIKSFDAWDSRKNDYVRDIRDAVEVVRCKDCIHREIQVDGVFRYEICGLRNEIINLEGFCHMGKRRKK